MAEWRRLVRNRLRELDVTGGRLNEIETELAQHLQRHYEERVSRGEDPVSARRRVEAELESDEISRRLAATLPADSSGAFWRRLLCGGGMDFRLAGRRLLGRPLFTLAVGATLAVALGANTLVFSVVYDVLLRPLPFDRPEQLYLLSQQQGEVSFPQLSFPDYLDLKAAPDLFVDAAALWIENWTVQRSGPPEKATGLAVTRNLFEILGVAPVLGRLPQPDDVGSDTPVVVLSHQRWVSRWGGSADVVGAGVDLDGVRHTVIGVLPPDFLLEIPVGPSFTIPNPEMLTLLDPALAARRSRKFSSFEVIARQQPGLTKAAIEERLQVVAARLQAAYPDSNQNRVFHATRLHDHLVAATRPMLLVLWSSVAALLLIACSNLAGLILSRTEARSREMATRLALGASPILLTRQVLSEAALLALIGSAAGGVLAVWGHPLLISLAPDGLPLLERVEPGWGAFLFGSLLALLAMTAISLNPLVILSRWSRRRLSLTGDNRVAFAMSPLRKAMLVVQFAMTFVLLAAALVFSSTLHSLAGVAPGFDTGHLHTFSITLASQRYPETGQILDFYNRLADDIGAISGVERVGFVSSLPLSGHNTGTSVRVEGLPGEADRIPHDAGWQVVLPGYFEAMGMAVIEGRDFVAQDHNDAVHRTLINRTLATRLFGDGAALGRRVAFGPDARPEWHEIIGVVADVHHLGLDRQPAPRAYDLYGQHGGSSMRGVVRSRRPTQSLRPLIRTRLQALDPEIPVTGEFTMDELLREQTAPERFMMTLSGLFAVMAVMVAGFGVYSVLSLVVGQRRHEFGIRRAMGATAGDIHRRIFGSTAGLLILGLTAGAAAFYLLSPLLEQLVFGITPTDPLLLGGAALLLLAMGAAGCLLPARRAGRVDPVRCLRPDDSS